MASSSSNVPAPRMQLGTVEIQMWPIVKQTSLWIEYAPSPLSLEKKKLDEILAMPGVQTAYEAAKKREELNPTVGKAVVLVEVHLTGAYVLEQGTGEEFEVSKIQFISTLEEKGEVLVYWPIWHKPQVQKKSSRPAAKKQRSKSTTRRAAANVATESALEADQDQQKPSKPVSNKRKRPTQQTGAKQQTDANRDEILEDLNAEQAVATEEYEKLENQQTTKRMKPMDNESETENVSASLNSQLQNDERSDETRANQEDIFEDSSAKQAVVTRDLEGLKKQREPEQVKPTDNRIEIEDVSAPMNPQLQTDEGCDETCANQEEIIEDSNAEETVVTRECEGLENQREPEQMKPMDTGMAEDVSEISGIEIEVVSAPRDQQLQKVEDSHETLREQIRKLQAENAEKDRALEDYQELKQKHEQAKAEKENLKAEVVLLRNQLNETEDKRDELSRKVGTYRERGAFEAKHQ